MEKARVVMIGLTFAIGSSVGAQLNFTGERHRSAHQRCVQGKAHPGRQLKGGPRRDL